MDFTALDLTLGLTAFLTGLAAGFAVGLMGVFIERVEWMLPAVVSRNFSTKISPAKEFDELQSQVSQPQDQESHYAEVDGAQGRGLNWGLYWSLGFRLGFSHCYLS